jgi:hypothetical protein
MNRKLMLCCFGCLTGAAVFLTCVSSRGLAPPLIPVNSTDYPAWRDAIHLKVFTNADSQLMEFSVLLEKPKEENTFWNLHLEVHQETNTVVSSDLGYSILAPLISAQLSDPQLANKTVQRFSFSLDPSLVTNSVIIFRELYHNPSKNPLGPYDAINPRIVRVADLCRPSEPPKSSPAQGAHQLK